jgi:large subunit ribosomal protein L6
MSRIGRLPVPVASGVAVAVEGRTVSVKGPKGSLTQELPAGISAEVADGKILVTRADESKPRKALHGLTRALLANAVAFTLGYTHTIDFPIPDGITIAVDRQTKITVAGIDRQKVGQVAAKIRALRPPDVYKAKGVKYAGEIIRKKAGKTGAK